MKSTPSDGKKKHATRKSVELPKIETQLKLLAGYYRAIQERPRPSYFTSTERLADQWEAIEATDPSIANSPTFLLRGRTHDDKPPLAQFFDYITDGYYPPPELLLTLLSVWKDYLQAAGDMRLEDAFLGPPVRKAGPYASRALKARKDLGIAFALGGLIARGKTKAEAAALIADQYGLPEESVRKIKPADPSPESREEEK